MMPRMDEPIQKRINAYNTAKELMEIPEMGALILVNNEACDSNLDKINFNLVNMLDAFFTDNSSSNVSNFDDSEKMKMLSDNGSFVIACCQGINQILCIAFFTLILGICFIA